MCSARIRLQKYGLVAPGIRGWQSWMSVLICGAIGSTALCRSNTGRGSSGWSRSTVGSGQFCTPWECMHAANLTMPRRAASTSAWVEVGAVVCGSRCWQALWAGWNWGLPASGITWTFGTFPLLSGSGKLDTPCERIQREKASAPFCDAALAEVREGGGAA